MQKDSWLRRSSRLVILYLCIKYTFMGWVVFFLCVTVAFGGFFNTEVDYFNSGSQERKEPPKEDYYEKVWKETQNWFPPNVSPIERELYKNPDDPVLRNLYVKYIEQRTQRARKIGTFLQDYFRTKESILNRLKDMGVKIYYFYSPACPYCAMSEDTARTLSNYVTIHKLNVDVPNPKIQSLIELFNVTSTPTLVAFTDREVLGIWVGAFTWDNLNFHRWLESLVSAKREEG